MVDLLVVAGDADFDARCDETVAAEVLARDIAEFFVPRFEAFRGCNKTAELSKCQCDCANEN